MLLKIIKCTFKKENYLKGKETCKIVVGASF